MTIMLYNKFYAMRRPKSSPAGKTGDRPLSEHDPGGLLLFIF